MKIVPMIVSTFIISFIRFDTDDIYVSVRSLAISRYVSMMSMIWITWSYRSLK